MKDYIAIPPDFAQRMNGLIPIYTDGNGNYYTPDASEAAYPNELLLNGKRKTIDETTLHTVTF